MSKFIYPLRESGAFSYLPTQDGLGMTTITTRRKRHTMVNEQAKCAALRTEIESLTGKAYSSMVARQYDKVERRWKGVTANEAEYDVIPWTVE